MLVQKRLWRRVYLQVVHKSCCLGYQTAAIALKMTALSMKLILALNCISAFCLGTGVADTCPATASVRCILPGLPGRDGQPGTPGPNELNGHNGRDRTAEHSGPQGPAGRDDILQEILKPFPCKGFFKNNSTTSYKYSVRWTAPTVAASLEGGGGQST